MEGKIQTLRLPFTLLLIGRENPNAQASVYVIVDWKGKSKRSGFRLRNKMAWNDQHSLESGSKSLLNKFEFLKTLLIECNAPLKIMLLYVGIVVVAVVITELYSLAEEEERRCTITPRPPSVATCRSGTPVKLSSIANSLVADGNTRDLMVWLIKAYDYNQSRVLSV